MKFKTVSQAAAPLVERAEIERLKADNARLRDALADLMSWFPEHPSQPEWRIEAGTHGADDAIAAARTALEETAP